MNFIADTPIEELLHKFTNKHIVSYDIMPHGPEVRCAEDTWHGKVNVGNGMIDVYDTNSASDKFTRDLVLDDLCRTDFETIAKECGAVIPSDAILEKPITLKISYIYNMLYNLEVQSVERTFESADNVCSVIDTCMRTSSPTCKDMLVRDATIYFEAVQPKHKRCLYDALPQIYSILGVNSKSNTDSDRLLDALSNRSDAKLSFLRIHLPAIWITEGSMQDDTAHEEGPLDLTLRPDVRDSQDAPAHLKQMRTRIADGIKKSHKSVEVYVFPEGTIPIDAYKSVIEKLGTHHDTYNINVGNGLNTARVFYQGENESLASKFGILFDLYDRGNTHPNVYIGWGHKLLKPMAKLALENSISPIVNVEKLPRKAVVPNTMLMLGSAAGGAMAGAGRPEGLIMSVACVIGSFLANSNYVKSVSKSVDEILSPCVHI